MKLEGDCVGYGALKKVLLIVLGIRILGLQLVVLFGRFKRYGPVGGGMSLGGGH